MKTLIIDDNDMIREGLKELLLAYCSQDIEEIKEANSLNNGLLAIQEYNPDVVFLDVELGDGTGMQLLEQLESIDFQLIFITAHNKYAIEGFRFSAIDFLLKPIDIEDLIESVEKAKTNLETKTIQEQYQVLFNHFKNLKTENTQENRKDKKIVLKTSEAIYFIQVKDIIRCEANGSYTVFVIDNQKNILISKGLKEYETLLSPYGFVRTHQSHLVNIHQIVRIDKQDGSEIIMQNNDRVPISHRKKEAIMEMIENI